MTKPDAPQEQPAEEPTTDNSDAAEATAALDPDLNNDGTETTDIAEQESADREDVDASTRRALPDHEYPALPVYAPASAGAETEEDSSSVYDQTAEAAEPQDKRPVKYALVGVAVGLLAGFCFNYAFTGIQEMVKTANATAITAAVTDCKVEDRDGITVTENGKKLTIDTKGAKDESGAASQNAVCLIQSLNVPTDVIRKLDSTKTGAERQSTEWDQRELSWEFSSDNGIMMEYSIKG
jgi:hypothetical protein